jgi:hypothetical protein
VIPTVTTMRPKGVPKPARSAAEATS